MNQGDRINWSGALGSEGPIQKLNGLNSADSSKRSEQETGDQGVPNISFSLPKKLDEPQGDTPNELPNGHNNAEDNAKGKSIGDLLEESEELPDTLLVIPTKDPLDSKEAQADGDGNKSGEAKDDNVIDSESDEKNPTKPEESQDMFDTSAEANKPTDNPDSKESGSTKEVEDSQGFNSFKLEVTESQFFKDNDSSQDSSKEPEEKDKDDKGDEAKDDGIAKDESDAQDKSPAASPGQSVVSSIEPSERPTVQSDNPESLQSIRTTPSVAEPCNCDPSCHTRVRSISERLSSACKQLGDFIKLKRRVENPDLANLLSVLTSIESIAENKPQSLASPLPDEVFYAESGSSKKKTISRSRYESTPVKEPAEKKSRRVDTPKPQPPKKVDFQTIKGLAVFAKWPNSGWYYPGVVEGLTSSDWKESTNVTVTFYDGLVREMKNINILPAGLIPPGVILCDLDDETEMLTKSCKINDGHQVEFKLSLKDNPNSSIDVGFNKLAIRATHMKSIKQLLEPTIDVVPKKMHMVSLDNLVSGRRSRVRTSKQDAEELLDTPRKGTRKSVRKAAEEGVPMDDDEAAEEGDAEPKETPSRKRSESIDQSSTPKRPTKRAKQ